MIILIINILKLILFDGSFFPQVLIIIFLESLITFKYKKGKLLVYLFEFSLGVPLIIDSFVSLYYFNYDVILNCHIYSLVGLSIYLLFFYKKNVIIDEFKNEIKKVNNKFIFFVIFFSFFISIIADILGLAKMGIENNVVLPFKLKGIINYLHFEIIPFLYLIIVDNSRKKYIYIFIIAWAAYESSLRGSRGFFIIFLAQVLVIYNLRKKISKNIFKPYIKYIPIAILIVLFLTVKRYEITISDLLNKLDLLIKFLNLIYNRVFSICLNSSDMINYFNNNQVTFIDIINEGSFSKFNTNVVSDLLSIAAKHSSGTSFFAEFYFFFGYFGVVLGAMVLSYYIFDLRNKISSNSIRVYLDFFIVFQFLNGGLITLLYFRPERILVLLFLVTIHKYLFKKGVIGN
jgi:hypothetical protein